MAALTESRRLVLLAKAAAAGRPVSITYRSEKPCAGVHGDKRTIEIHDLKLTQDGRYVAVAYCYPCQQVEHFRVDRISSHRTLRHAWRGPIPKVSRFFTVLGTPTARQVSEPMGAPTYSAPGLLARVREKIALARIPREPLTAGHMTVVA